MTAPAHEPLQRGGQCQGTLCKKDGWLLQSGCHARVEGCELAANLWGVDAHDGQVFGTVRAHQVAVEGTHVLADSQQVQSERQRTGCPALVAELASQLVFSDFRVVQIWLREHVASGTTAPRLYSSVVESW